MEQTIFQTAMKRWNGLSKEQKTPDFFLSFFTLENGAFESVDEMARNMDAIFALIDAQEWTDSEKDQTKTEMQFKAYPELAKDFAPYSVSKFFDDVASYDPKKDFFPCYMNGIAFQQQTFNIVAARPSRAKTTICVCFALDCLQNKAGSKVVIISLEETKREIYTRIFNNLIFDDYRKENLFYKLIAKKDNPRGSLWQAMKRGNEYIANADDDYYQKVLARIRAKVEQWESESRLKVIDMSGKNINAIENVLKFNRGALIIVDYVQLIRPDPTKYNALDGINDIANRLADSAKTNEQIIIGAAQLRRLGEGASDSDIPNAINDTQLKDSGQFEQNANTIIALGRNTSENPSEPVYFWKLIKNRNGGGVNSSYRFQSKFNEIESLGFSFLLGTDKKAFYLDSLKSQSKKEKAEKSKPEPKAAELRGDYC